MQRHEKGVTENIKNNLHYLSYKRLLGNLYGINQVPEYLSIILSSLSFDILMTSGDILNDIFNCFEKFKSS